MKLNRMARPEQDDFVIETSLRSSTLFASRLLVLGNKSKINLLGSLAPILNPIQLINRE